MCEFNFLAAAILMIELRDVASNSLVENNSSSISAYCLHQNDEPP
jgi:hypothetical protein